MDEKHITIKDYDIVTIGTDQGFVSISSDAEGKIHVMINANRIGRTVETKRHDHHIIEVIMKEDDQKFRSSCVLCKFYNSCAIVDDLVKGSSIKDFTKNWSCSRWEREIEKD